MKVFIFLLINCIAVSPALAQIGISADQWRQDVEFLQKTVQDDYRFLFKKVTAEQFDRQVDTLLKALPDLEEHQIVTGLARLVASFQYGHTALGLHGGQFEYHQLPINLYQFGEEIFVEGTREDYQRLLGSKLVAVNGIEVQQALRAVRPVVPAENDQYFRAHGIHYLGIPEVLHAQGVLSELQHEITLTIEKDGRRSDEVVTAERNVDMPGQYGFIKANDRWLSSRDHNATPLYLKHLDRIYFFDYLPEQKTVYVRHSQIQDDPQEAIPAFYNRLFQFIEENEVERLVLDVRLNGGGNNYKNKPIVTGIVRCEKINQIGKFYVIIGRRTFSACQNLVNELSNYTNAVFVGEPTSENINFYGDNRRVELPNSKLPVHLSFAWWQDKPQWENGPWLAPHLAVEMSFDDYRHNRDPVLETALTSQNDDLVLDPMARMTELFSSGKLEQLKREAKQLVDDPRYRYFDLEPKANRAGYDLLNGEQIEGAIFVFQLNTELFPSSANAWDSLAEAYMKAHQFDEAIESYKRAIELDPEGSIGDNARNMLRQIKSRSSQ